MKTPMFFVRKEEDNAARKGKSPFVHPAGSERTSCLPTRQACAFADAWEDYAALGVTVIGISKDSVSSHQKFSQKYQLPFILLSDPELHAIQAYGVWQEKKLYGKTSMGVVRTTYLIDENGMIEKAMPKVKPDDNATEILSYLRGK